MKPIKQMYKSVSLLVAMMTLVGCASVHTETIIVNQVDLLVREDKAVEFLQMNPYREAINIGIIKTDGNEFSEHNDLISEGKKKAAAMGADFIMLVDSGSKTETTLNPGYSSFQSSASSTKNSTNAQSALSTSGQSVGPSVTTYHYPWAIFSVWVYKPSRPGVYLDEQGVVTGFDLNSDADAAGIQLGDRILGIDGYDIKDAALANHLMTVHPGTTMEYTVLRNGKREKFSITSLSN